MSESTRQTSPSLPVSENFVGTETALRHWGAHARIWCVMGFGLAADLWTKQWAFRELEQPQVIIPDVLSFQRSLNAGALMGIGQGMAPLFIAASFLALVFVFYIFSRSHRDHRSYHIGLGMILAGAIGNLYDRLFVGGKVRDFISIELMVYDRKIWPWIFNVADMLLVCGVTILLLNIWFERKTHRSHREQLKTEN